jgi:cytochrome P450
VLCGHSLPKGTTVSVNFWTAQLDPQYWKEPQKFNPDRWDDPEEGKHPFSYLPFSAGARNWCVSCCTIIYHTRIAILTFLCASYSCICSIGQKFAMQEIMITLSMLMQHFNAEHDSSKKVWPAFEGVMLPVNLFVKFTRRGELH